MMTKQQHFLHDIWWWPNHSIVFPLADSPDTDSYRACLMCLSQS